MGIINKFITENKLDNSMSIISTSLDNITEQTVKIDDVLTILNNMNCPEANATENDLLLNKIAYNKEGKIVGTIPTKDASNLQVNGSSITTPSGYYATDVTKSVTSTAQATPSISIDGNGLITATSSQNEGYVAAGTKNATEQLTTQGAKTITPTTSSQTAVAKNVYTTDAITVAAIPSSYVKPSSTKEATTYTPGTSNQTIAAGTYCSGAQTISGDSNLKAENIKGGVTIFNVKGTYTGGEIPYYYVQIPDPIEAGDYPIAGLTTSEKVTNTSNYVDTGLNFTANRAGTYRFKWTCMKPAMTLGGSGTSSTALFLNNVEYYSNSSFSDNTNYNTVDVAMNVGDTVSVRCKHGGNMYATYIYGVHVCIKWDNPNAFFTY